MDLPTLALSLSPWAPVFLAWLKYRAEIRQALAPKPPTDDAPPGLVVRVRQVAQQAEEAARMVRSAQPLSVRELSRQAAVMAAQELAAPGGVLDQKLESRFETLRADLRSATPNPADPRAYTDAWGHALRVELQGLGRDLRAETAKLAEERAEAVARRSVSDLAEKVGDLDEKLGESRVEDARALGRVEGALQSPAEGYSPAPRRRR